MPSSKKETAMNAIPLRTNDDQNVPGEQEAEAAFRTIIRWAGDDPNREGLSHTPRRMARAYREYFSGYRVDPATVLSTTFEEIGGYDEMIVLRDIAFESHCEHRIAANIGQAWVGYVPEHRSSAFPSSRASSSSTRNACRYKSGSPPRSPTRFAKCLSRKA